VVKDKDVTYICFLVSSNVDGLVFIMTHPIRRAIVLARCD